MPQGIQIFDQFGVNQLDTNDRIFKKIGSIIIGQNGSTNSSLSDPKYQYVQNKQATFGYVLIPNGASGALLYSMPKISFSGTTISWTWPDNNRFLCTLIYGMY